MKITIVPAKYGAAGLSREQIDALVNIAQEELDVAQSSNHEVDRGARQMLALVLSDLNLTSYAYTRLVTSAVDMPDAIATIEGFLMDYGPRDCEHDEPDYRAFAQ